MVFADLIIPIFTFPYLMLGAPLAIATAMGAEMVVFGLSKPRLQLSRIVAGTLGANALSWLFGILASVCIFGSFFGGFGIRSDPKTEIRYLWWGILTAFFVAFLLSTMIEYLVWRWLKRWWIVSPTLTFVTAANSVSYIVLFLFFYAMNHHLEGFGWH